MLISLPLPQKSTVEEPEPCVQEDTVSIYDSALSLRQKLKSFNTTLRKYRRSTDTKNADETDVASQSAIDFNNIETSFTWKSEYKFLGCVSLQLVLSNMQIDD